MSRREGQSAKRPLAPCPYKGLRPYSERDAHLFFGRDAEREIIASNLVASRLTLLYGASGVGKTSVLRAGVIYDINQMSRQDVAANREPEFIGAVVRDWIGDPLSSLQSEMARAARAVLGDAMPEAPPAGASLTETLEAWSDRTGAVLLIVLDQFEEFLLYHHTARNGGAFADQLARAVRARALPANFLVGIREDALARLDHFKGQIPNLFDNYLRLAHLDAPAAREAVHGPIREYNRRMAEGDQVVADDALVEAVIKQVKTDEIGLGRTGQGGVSQSAGIETPFLQLVMLKLWDEELGRGSHRLQLEALERLGGASQIVRSHLAEQMERLSPAEQDLAARSFHHLVTPSGAKIAHRLSDLAQYVGVPPEQLGPVLEKLTEGEWRVLRPVADRADPDNPSFEIFHDVLTEAVLDWRASHQSGQAAVAERHRIRRRWLPILIGALVLVAIGSSVLTIFAINQREDAQQARNEANSRQLATLAQQQLPAKPELSILLAREAVDLAPTREAVEALRGALGDYRTRGTLRGHRDRVWDLDWSPGGTRVVTASDDGTARVWDSTSGRTLARLEGHDGAVYAARFSPQGDRIVTAGDDGTVRLWDPEGEGTVVQRAHGGPVNDANFDPVGDRVVTASGDGSARILDSRDGRRLVVLRGHRRGVQTAEFDGRGRYVVTASADRTARVWNARTGRLVDELRHAGAVTVARFDPAGEHVVTASRDGTARVVELATGTVRRLGPPRMFRRERAPVNDARFSQSGERVVTASTDRSAQIWDVESGQLEQSLQGHRGAVHAAEFSPDGRTVVTASDDGTATTWDARNGQRLVVVRGHRRGAYLAAFSPGPNANLIVTAGGDREARLSDARDEPAAVMQHAGGVSTAVFDHTGGKVVTASSDAKVRIWDWRTATDEPLQTIEEQAPVRTAAIDPDGRLVVAATGDPVFETPGEARVYSARTGELSGKPLIGHRGSVSAASFSPDGEHILTASADRTARLWSVEGREELRVFRGHKAGVSDAQFSPDGRLVVTAGFDGATRVWDRASGRSLTTLRTASAEKDPLISFFSLNAVITAVFDGSAKRVATASYDGTANIWHVASNVRRDLVGHTQPVSSAAVSPDNRTVATSSEDGSVRLWDLRTAEELTTLQVSGRPVWSVAFSPDGQWITTASEDKTVRVYRCPVCGSVDRLMKASEQRVNRSLTPREEKTYLPE